MGPQTPPPSPSSGWQDTHTQPKTHIRVTPRIWEHQCGTSLTFAFKADLGQHVMRMGPWSQSRPPPEPHVAGEVGVWGSPRARRPASPRGTEGARPVLGSLPTSRGRGGPSSRAGMGQVGQVEEGRSCVCLGPFPELGVGEAGTSQHRQGHAPVLRGLWKPRCPQAPSWAPDVTWGVGGGGEP